MMPLATQATQILAWLRCVYGFVCETYILEGLQFVFSPAGKILQRHDEAEPELVLVLFAPELVQSREVVVLRHTCPNIFHHLPKEHSVASKGGEGGLM